MEIPRSTPWVAAFTLLLGCASGDEYTRQGEGRWYGRREGQVWVRGPWPTVKPSPDVDDIIDQLCPAIMQLPRANLGDYGQEYCGAIYSRDGLYYASHGSPLGRIVIVGATKRKSCTAPRHVEDGQGRVATFGDYHSHPWFPSPMTREDRLAENQLWHLRIQFDSGCHIMKLIPYMGEDRPGEVYERRDKNWVLIGHIQPEDKPFGTITPVGGE